MSEIENNSISLPPDLIHNSEILIRIFYHPDHVDELGNIKSSAISSEDLKTRGVSVDRKNYANKNYIATNIENSIVRKEGRNLSGFGLIKHESVLNINDTNNKSALHVKADPIQNNPAHALILAKNSYLPSELKKLRKALIDELAFVKTLDEALA